MRVFRRRMPSKEKEGELFERGIMLTITPVLYEPIIRVPLLVWTPGQKQRHDEYSITSCVDILPT